LELEFSLNKIVDMGKVYMKPVAVPIKLINEDVMLTASPGVGGDYDPSQGIDAKKNNFFDEELNGKWPSYNLWDE